MSGRALTAAIVAVAYFGGIAWLVNNQTPWWFCLLVVVIGAPFGMFCVGSAMVSDEEMLRGRD